MKLPSARSLARFLKAAQEAARLKGQVTVLLTTDAAIRDLNRRFRGKNKATDVLSFPAEGPIPNLSAEGIAGDIAISVTTALRQAAGQGHSVATEIKVLILHGVLHLAGFDHEADAGQMARRERVLRGRLGLPLGLIERAGAGAIPQGLKPGTSFGQSSARLKSCPVTKLSSVAARLKPRPFKASKPKTKVNSAATIVQDDRENGARGVEVSHPRSPHGRGPVHGDPDSRKNKDAVPRGRPGGHPLRRPAQEHSAQKFAAKAKLP
ncbi:MAG: rRNA maturation RNase YbeY [Terracidiphilus sp.]